MPNGFRQPAEASRKEQLRALATELKNTQAAQRISQMMLQQMIQNNQNISYDLGKALTMISELQYKFLAVQKVANLDDSAIQAAADTLRLQDFNDTSAKEDTDKGYTVGDIVKEDSIVILTSVSAEPDKSIFRSKIGLKEANVPELTKGLLGREVGAKVVLDLGGTQHTVELLGIRYPAPAPVENNNQPSDTTPAPVEAAPTVG